MLCYCSLINNNYYYYYYYYYNSVDSIEDLLYSVNTTLTAFTTYVANARSTSSFYNFRSIPAHVYRYDLFRSCTLCY